ncbi:MAG: hypothetical protein QXS81_01365 [Candidatus Micrarchaeaceae archaeon]
MTKIKFEGKKYPLHTYLSASEVASLRLGLRQRLRLLLFGSVPLPEAVPPDGCTYTIFLVRSAEGFYFSYPQGWYEEFYAPEETKFR